MTIKDLVRTFERMPYWRQLLYAVLIGALAGVIQLLVEATNG